MDAQYDDTSELPDVLMEVLGAQVAEVRRGWEREISRIGAEARATISELRAENAVLKAELKELHAGLKVSVDDMLGRLERAMAGVKDGAPGPQGPAGVGIAEMSDDGDNMAVHLTDGRTHVFRGLRGPPGPQGEKGEPGPSGERGEPGPPPEPTVLERMIGDAVAKMPAPEPGPRGERGADGAPGKDADPELVRRMAREAVAELPPAAPGKDGKDGVGIAHIKQLGDEAVLLLTNGDEAVLTLPVGPSGTSIDRAEVEKMVDDAVVKRPLPRDGRDGEPGPPPDPALLERMVADAFAKAPAPERGPRGEPGERGEPGPAGKDADPEHTRRMVKEMLSELPPAPPGKDGKDGVGIARLKQLGDEVVALLTDGREEVFKLIPGPAGPAGRDADWPQIENAIKGLFASIPTPRDGEPGPPPDPELLQRMIEDVQARNPPQPGPRGEKGEPGRDADVGEIMKGLAAMVEALPKPRDGRDGVDGKSVTADDVLPALITRMHELVTGEIEKRLPDHHLSAEELSNRIERALNGGHRT